MIAQAEADHRHLVVVAALVEREGRLLARQRPEGKWGAGRWEFPGGKVDSHEDPRQALARECLEELGVDTYIGAAYDVHSHAYEDLGSIILIFFRARIINDAEPLELEGAKLRWVDPDEARTLDWLEADRPLIRQWLADQRAS
jgi:8-oxo-dGTP diphosphatase